MNSNSRLRQQPAVKATKNTPGSGSGEAAAWAEHAEALADWALGHLFVRRDVFGAYKPNGGQYTGHEPVMRERIIRHFQGKPGAILGAHTTTPDSRCKAITFDIDAHDDGADPEANWRFALVVADRLGGLGLDPLLCESNGKGGYHVRAIFKKPVSAEVVRWLGERIISDWADHGLASAPEVFPKQGELTLDRPYGNWIRLPGRHHKRDHWTRIYDRAEGDWISGEAAVLRLIGATGRDAGKVIEAYRAETEARSKVASNGQTSRKPAGRGKRQGKADEATVRDALAHLPASWADSYGGKRADTGWLGVGMALHDWDSGIGLSLWQEFSANCPNKYDPSACDAKWGTFSSGGGLTVGSIFAEAERNGWKPPWRKRSDGKPWPDPAHPFRVVFHGESGYEPTEEATGPGDLGPIPYGEQGGCLILETEGRGGPILTTIANFSARIVAQIERHEQGRIFRQFQIKAKHSDGSVGEAIVLAEEYERMGWVAAQLGAEWAIAAQRGSKEHVRAAIQLLSHRDGIGRATVHTSLGWIDHKGSPLYLHAGGAIGEQGASELVKVETSPALAQYRLPDPPTDREIIRRAVESCLGILSLAKQKRPNSGSVAAVLATLPIRSILGASDFTIHFSGSTGTRKTSAARTAHQHHAVGIETGDRMPVSWRATPGSLQRYAYDCKDSLLIIDELTGEQAVSTATEFVQCQGNLKGRDRMDKSLRLAPSLDPRGSVLSTGEADPTRQSALGRMLTVTFTPETIDLDALTACQSDAANGLYALAMSAFIRWLATDRRIEAIREDHKAEVERRSGEIRKETEGRNVHPRHPAIVAELASAYRVFLRFAVEQGGLAELTARAYAEAIDRHLMGLLIEQGEAQQERNPAHRFMALLRSGLASHRFHLLNAIGDEVPIDYAEACGWHKDWLYQGEDGQMLDWQIPNNSKKVGYIDASKGIVYLMPDMAPVVATTMARDQGGTFENVGSIGRDLLDAGLVVAGNEGNKRRSTIRKRIKTAGNGRYHAIPVRIMFGEADPGEGTDLDPVPTVPTSEI